jgi:hypothetical protein
MGTETANATMAVHCGSQTYDHIWLTNLVAKGKSKASCRKTLQCSEVSLPMYNRCEKKHTYGSHGNPTCLLLTPLLRERQGWAHTG